MGAVQGKTAVLLHGLARSLLSSLNLMGSRAPPRVTQAGALVARYAGSTVISAERFVSSVLCESFFEFFDSGEVSSASRGAWRLLRSRETTEYHLRKALDGLAGSLEVGANGALEIDESLASSSITIGDRMKIVAARHDPRQTIALEPQPILTNQKLQSSIPPLHCATVYRERPAIASEVLVWGSRSRAGPRP